jgi:gliding motility-associated-like protein
VIVEDNEDPSFTSCITADQTESMDAGECTYTHTGSAWDALADDNCTVSSVTAELTGATTGSGLLTLNNVVFNPGTTTVTWTVTDNSGNTEQCIFDVIVEDNEDPVISACPTTISVNTDAGVCGATVNWTIPAYSDNCGATMIASHTPGTLFPVGTTVVTYTVTDGSGNNAVCTFNVVVSDNEDPVLSCPSNISTCNPIVNFTFPTATDNCGTTGVVQTAGLPSGATYPVGTTTNAYVVQDIHGNESICSFTVTIFPTPSLSFDATDISCFGENDGSIDLSVNSGTAPFNYAWTGGYSSQDISDLSQGTYNVLVTDFNGCTASGSATIDEPSQMTFIKDVENVTCFNGNNGSIDVTIGGGIAPYNYNWSGAITSTDEDLTDLTIGQYIVEVTDQNGCLIVNSTSITQPNEIIIIGSSSNATCSANNGSVSVSVTGGVSPYTYAWDNGSTLQNLSNVSGGTYTLTVTDANGCLAQYTDTVESLSNLSAYVEISDVLCYGDSTGSATVIVESGSQPFTYLWSDGSQHQSNFNLAAGPYSVIVMDYLGCQTTVNFTVNQPEELTLTLSPSVYSGGFNISAYEEEDGYILSNVQGGVEPYNYTWFTEPPQTTENAYGLGAGYYTLSVSDDNGCVVSAAIRLIGPIELAMPEGVSPNGDGDNDFFVIKGIEAYPDNYITIYNRWGNIVFETSSYNNEWEGQNNKGDEVPDGTYFVVFEANGATGTTTLTGYVDLRRSR